MSSREARSFSREFKLRAVQRVEAGENVSALSRELTVKREVLYRWRDAFRMGGPEALRLRGRPSKADDLAEARWQIEQLRRKAGQQQLDLDFFKRALRRIEASRRPNDGPGETASSPTSER